jgi:pimeloyl-ACP methyl ester carboxylesterase
VVHGTDDRTLGVDAVRAVADAIPNASLRLLEGLGHRPDIRRPDVFNPILTEFASSEAVVDAREEGSKEALT